MPLVSIGIPFHNPGGLLEGAIRSIQSQTLKDWELLLVNDGSTDGSIDIAQRFAEIDARIRFFNDGEKRGLVDRLNQIADLACCKMLARMDADDLMHPQRLQVQSDFLNSHTSIDLVDTGTIIIDNRRVPWASSGLNTPPWFTIEEIFKSGGIAHPTILVRSDWARMHRYSPDYIRAEDRELWVRTFRTSRFAHLPMALYYYRLIGNLREKEWLLSYKSTRKIIWRYGPKNIGITTTVWLWLLNMSKALVLPVIVSTGFGDHVAKRGRVRLTPEERKEHKATIAGILDR